MAGEIVCVRSGLLNRLLKRRPFVTADARGSVTPSESATAFPGGILPCEGRILQSLNLKNPRAYSLAAELAQLTGESLTASVIAALEHQLEAERRKRGGRTTAE